MGQTILVIDDDPALLSLLRTIFVGEGFNVLTCESGPAGMKLAFNEHPDLIILDRMLPGINGLDVCRRMQDMCDIPIILLTALATEADIVQGLAAGADDYITKPFRISELLARTRASLRRHGKSSDSSRPAVLVLGGLSIDLAQHRVTAGGKPVHLTPTEFDLLSCLAQSAGRVVPHRTLLIHVWGPEYANETEYLHLYMRYLRQKIERDPGKPSIIKNERGVGYYLDC